MPPRSALRVAADQARLYREAERLTDRFRARVAPDDDTASEQFLRQRKLILDQIQALGPAPAAADAGDAEEVGRYVADSAAAVGRTIALNRELIALLEAEKARLRHKLAEIGASRRALTSYQGGAPQSPVFVDQRQ